MRPNCLYEMRRLGKSVRSETAWSGMAMAYMETGIQHFQSWLLVSITRVDLHSTSVVDDVIEIFMPSK